MTLRTILFPAAWLASRAGSGVGRTTAPGQG